ncbi:MAG: hypothetical protein IT445_10825 [Phycisphaeraceae bacterium]|nr:hypothetical protein [Phycisphaeraceae bacterium]
MQREVRICMDVQASRHRKTELEIKELNHDRKSDTRETGQPKGNPLPQLWHAPQRMAGSGWRHPERQDVLL